MRSFAELFFWLIDAQQLFRRTVLWLVGMFVIRWFSLIKEGVRICYPFTRELQGVRNLSIWQLTTDSLTTYN
jgi:hypothetical protein